MRSVQILVLMTALGVLPAFGKSLPSAESMVWLASPKAQWWARVNHLQIGHFVDLTPEMAAAIGSDTLTEEHRERIKAAHLSPELITSIRQGRFTGDLIDAGMYIPGPDDERAARTARQQLRWRDDRAGSFHQPRTRLIVRHDTSSGVQTLEGDYQHPNPRDPMNSIRLWTGSKSVVVAPEDLVEQPIVLRGDADVPAEWARAR
jgi:hypothetical protein